MMVICYHLILFTNCLWVIQVKEGEQQNRWSPSRCLDFGEEDLAWF